jgi:ligand-binding SRPBCC domain-containing protein
MPVIEITTHIYSDIETVFDLARSIDLHSISTARTNEKAIAGKISGLINHGEYVTWQARHFGIIQQLTSKISGYDRPYHFRDELVKGAFRSIVHDHHFEVADGIVIMKDVFRFESPMGLIGKAVNNIILIRYMKKFLMERNAVIKEYAETDKGKKLLHNEM